MSRYIDADKIIYERATVDTKHGRVEACVAYWSDIQLIPTADVRENVRGEWKYHSSASNLMHCSLCGYSTEAVLCYTPGQTAIPEKIMYHFCPNCGADMRSEKV